MLFVTLIPTCRNDGSPVSQVELDEILTGLWMRFGGCTVEGIVEGHWIDTADGRHYCDRNLKVKVVCPPERVDEARAYVRDIGQRLGQIVMYFEVRDDPVEFVDVPHDG